MAEHKTPVRAKRQLDSQWGSQLALLQQGSQWDNDKQAADRSGAVLKKRNLCLTLFLDLFRYVSILNRLLNTF